MSIQFLVLINTLSKPDLFFATGALETRDRREYQYRIEKADTKPFGISIGLDRGFF